MVRVDGDMSAQARIESGPDASGALVVNVIGEIDISNADTLGSALEAVVADSTDVLALDLSALDFLDSSGLAMLLRIAGRARSVEVRNPTNVVRRIIEATGLDTVLRIAP